MEWRPENMIKNRFYSSIKKRIAKGDFGNNLKNKIGYIIKIYLNQMRMEIIKIKRSKNYF